MKALARYAINPKWVHATPDNTRTIDFDDPHLNELAASLYHDGQLQECVCRPHPQRTLTVDDELDLRAGERRWLAAIIADVPLQVAVYEMTDDEALRITVLENLHREELHPLDEAEAIGKLFERGWTAEQVAAEVGKSAVWVSRRARLRSLVPGWRQAVYGESATHPRWGVAHLELLARYEPAEQKQMLVDYKYSGHFTVKQLQDDLARRMHALASARFDLGNAELPGGACSECPKRSSCNPLLFDEMNDKAKDCCLDSQCWQRKEAAWLELEIRVRRAQHPNLVLVGNVTKRKDVLAQWNVERVKKSAPGAVPALLVDDDPGKVVWVKPRLDRLQAAKQVAAAQGPAEQLAAKREQLWRRRLAWCFEQLFAKLFEPPDWLNPGCERQLIRLLAVWGTGNTSAGIWDECSEYRAHVGPVEAEALLAKKEVADLHLFAWQRLAKSIQVNWESYYVVPSNLTRHEEAEANARFLAALLLVDFAGLWAQAEAAKPEPKAWRKLEKAAAAAPEDLGTEPAPAEDDEEDEDDAVPGFEVRSCRICGCTDDEGCMDDDGEMCHWVEDDLCSACVGQVGGAK